MDQLKKEFANDPVAFIGISSGHDPKHCLAYAKSVKTEWAIYSDNDRSFEQGTIHATISLQNIHQTRMLLPNGKLVGGGDTSEAIKKHVADAKWKMDGKDFPTPLKKAWQAYEFGQYGV